MYDMAFHQVVPGKITYVPYVKRIQRLLPAPFKTECYDYDSEQEDITARFEFNVLTREGQALTSEGLAIYHNRGECFLYCMWRLLNTRRCINFYSIYTEELVDYEIKARIREQLILFKDRPLIDNTRILASGSGSSSNTTTKSERDLNNLVKFCKRTEDDEEVRTGEAFKDYIKTKHQCLKVCPEACDVETYSEEDMYDEETHKESDARSAKINIKSSPKPYIFILHRYIEAFLNKAHLDYY